MAEIIKKEKILVCEFITAGGLRDSHFGGDGETLPATLLKEGSKMRDALLCDLSALNQYELLVMQDVRLPPVNDAHQSIVVDSNDFRKALKKALKQADYVWLIAPETNAALIELTEICLAEEEKENGAIFLGCGYHATLAGTSKTLCFEALQKASIYTLPVFGGDDLLNADFFAHALKQHDGKWVAKPEDGAGCAGIRLFDSLPLLRNWLVENAFADNYLAQPYQAGIAASISILCRNGRAWVLS
ncbi:MAG TPA: ATP-grasp domain-containing protein, partial [Methylotenera sp.]|nr:ATP-grasp domain-containing protein [Methylotenera sp.]